MKWLRVTLITLFVIILTTGCDTLLGATVPTPYPTGYIPTVIALTVAAGQQPVDATTAAQGTDPAAAAVASATPALPLASATHTPTAPVSANATPTTPEPVTVTATHQAPTLTPTPGIPNTQIQIAAPGPASRIISPLKLEATVRCVPSGSFHIELWAEPLRPGDEPRLLLRKVTNFVADPLNWFFLEEELEFELSRVSELAELRVLTFDPFGRPVAASSVEVILLQMGENQLNPPGDVLEPLSIYEPAPNTLILGGTLVVSGMARPLDSQPLLVELITARDSVVGYHMIFLAQNPSGGHMPFTAEVQYSVSSPTWVRLVLSQSGTRIPGVRLLNSLEVLLSP